MSYIKKSQIGRPVDQNDQLAPAQIVTGGQPGGVGPSDESFNDNVISQLKRIIFGSVSGNFYSDFSGLGIKDLAQLTASTSGSASPVLFSYNSSSPLVIAPLPSNTVVDGVEVKIDVAFDDPTATLSVGTVASPDLILPLVPANTESSFANDEAFKVSISDFLRLTINPGISTQGSGYVIYSLRS